MKYFQFIFFLFLIVTLPGCNENKKVDFKKLDNDVQEDSINLKKKVFELYNKINSNNSVGIRNLGLETIELANKQNNIYTAALASEYLAFFYSNKFINDSAFYFYNLAKDNYAFIEDVGESRMLLNLAILQELENDLVGSEINTIKSLELLEKRGDDLSKYLAYNNLGVVNNKLNRFDESIAYYGKSLNYLVNDSHKEKYEAVTLNNIGQAYSSKLLFNKAIEYYNKGIELYNNKDKYQLNYATLVDNKAYALFKLKKYKQLPKLFFEALKIRDSLNIKDGQVESNLHISEYYASVKDTLLALSFAEKAEMIAREANYNDGLLNAYKLLAQLNQNNKSIYYLNNHIKLSETLQQQEREIREKFTRIAYETDEVIHEKEELSRKNWWITTISSLVILLGGITFFFFQQRARNKELKLLQAQDQANIKIYELMLNQQREFQKGIDVERNRISKDLHDGVLSKIFGTRLSLDGLNNSVAPEDIIEREHQIQKLQSIEEEVRSLSHNLRSNELEYKAKFSKLIYDLIEEQSVISEFEYELNIDKQVSFEGFENEVKINIYRIIQEALYNVTKYAKASKVNISFHIENKQLYVKIQDNGVGFHKEKKAKGIGLKNMISRAKKMKGTLTINSNKGQGTLITVKIPY